MPAKIYFTDDDDLFDICRDNVFKAVFTKNTPASKGALSKFVSALIGREVSIITIIANEPPIENTQDRQIRYDINCRAESGELINVEMCFNPSSFKPARFEYYADKLFINQDIKGENKTYSDLKMAFQITILANERFFKDEVFFHTFEYYDPVNQIPLGGQCRIITLELSKLEKIAKKPPEEMSLQEQWAVYFRYLTDKSKRIIINEIMEHEEGIAMASEALMTISKEEAERFRLISEEKYELDRRSDLAYATEKGMEKGMQKIVEMLKNGKSREEIIKDYENGNY